MRPTRWPVLILLAAIAAAAGAVGLRWWTGAGHSAPPVPVSALVGTALLAVVVWIAGGPIRRWTGGDRSRPLDPLLAVRTVVLAKASAHAGAILFGWCAALVATLAPNLEIEPQRARAVLAAVWLLASAGLVIAGLLVERSGRIPPQDDDQQLPDERSRPGRR